MKINPLLAVSCTIIVLATLLGAIKATETPIQEVAPSILQTTQRDDTARDALGDEVQGRIEDATTVQYGQNVLGYTVSSDYLQASGEDGSYFQPTTHSASLIQ